METTDAIKHAVRIANEYDDEVCVFTDEILNESHDHHTCLLVDKQGKIRKHNFQEQK